MEREIADGAPGSCGASPGRESRGLERAAAQGGGVAPPRSAALLQIDGAPVRFVA
jgi:hypothetical protein